MSEGKQCLQRDVTEVDVSKKKCGKNVLDACCVPTSFDEYIAMVKTGNECQLSAYYFLFGKCAIAEVLFQSSFLHAVGTLHAEYGTYHGT